MTIHKVTGDTVNLNNNTSNVNFAGLVSIYNTSTSAVATIANTTTGFSIPVGPNERLVLEKSTDDELACADIGTFVYATPIAYKS